ncbi:MAG: hypothetical protein ABWX84_04105 [Nocardioides sp.]
MSNVDVLRHSIAHTHENLENRLQRARAMTHAPDQPRQALEVLDGFLAMSSKHLGAVDAVLVPAVHAQVRHGDRLVHEYVHAEKELELALAHVKARAYGSAYDVDRSWTSVWDDVATSLETHGQSESALAEALTQALDNEALDELTERMQGAEAIAPTRPHPYAPHTGLAGQVSRRVMHAVDAFWDTTEGRMVPEPERRARPKPGRVAQYFLADPRFDEEDPPDPDR